MTITPIITEEFNNVQGTYNVIDRQVSGQDGFGLVDSADEIRFVRTSDFVVFDDPKFQQELQKYSPPTSCLSWGSGCYQRSLQLLNPRNFTSDDVLVDKKINFEIPEMLTAEQVTEDIDYAIYILQTAYVGYFVLHDQVQVAIQELTSLREGPTAMTPSEMEGKISEIFSKIPDGHLGVEFVQEPSVQATNIASGDEQGTSADQQLKSSWSVRDLTLHAAGRKFTVPVIKLREMIVEDDPSFAAAMQEAVARSDALIIDLWNNGGGDNPPESLLSLLTDQKLIARDAYRLYTPEAHAIRANQFEYQKQRGEFFSQGALDDRNGAYQEYSANDFPMWEHFEGERSVRPEAQKPYAKPVYVLINRRDASTTEETIALLRQMPNVTLVGQPTRGALHFGGCGRAFLPNSGLTLWAGTMFSELRSNQYKDHTFIEGTGFQPDIYTPIRKRGGNRDRAERIAERELRKYFKSTQTSEDK